jgi:hypothetical protein
MRQQMKRFFIVLFVFLFAFSSFNISVFSYELSPAPTQVVLEDKEPEKLYYFDPLPTFSSSGTLNEISTIVYEMGEVISGSINENQTVPWYAILRDTTGSDVSVQQISGGKYFSLSSSVNKDGKYFIVLTDSLTSPTWTLTQEIYIKYKVDITFADVKACSNCNCVISGVIKSGQNLPISHSVNLQVAYPDKKLAVSSSSSGNFSVTFPSVSMLGVMYLYISDGYPVVSPDNDSIVYAFIPNYTLTIWTLSEIVPQAPLYSDEEGNLSQSIVLYLQDSNGAPISGKKDMFNISLAWSNPQVKEIAEGVYKIYGGTLKGSSVEIYVKEVIASNRIVKTLKKLSYFNPYIDIDAKYSPSPFGTGPYDDLTIGRKVFDAIPLKLGSSLEIKAGVFSIPSIKDPANPKYTLKDNYYVYKFNVNFSPSLEKHSINVEDSNVFYVKGSSAYVNISEIVWERAKKDSTPTWSTVAPDPYNACCVKNLSETFSFATSAPQCITNVSSQTFTVGVPKDLAIPSPSSFSVVHIYMLDENGKKIPDGITVSYKQGKERKTLSDLWFNPLHIAGTNIPDLPISFSYDDGVDVVYSSSNVVFKDVTFNYTTNHPLFKNKVIVEIYTKYNDTYPCCGILDNVVEVLPQIKTLDGTYSVISSKGISDKLTANVEQKLMLELNNTFTDVYFNILLNKKPISSYKIDFSYSKVSEGKYLISFSRPIPYDENYSPNVLTVEFEAFKSDRTEEEVAKFDITVNKLVKEANPPLINIIGPKDGELLNSKTVVVEGKVTDDTGVKELLINGQDVPISEGSFKNVLPLNEGENVIEIEAIDVFDNKKDVTLKVYVDTTPPTFTLNYPTETTSESVTISGTTESDAKVFLRDGEIGNVNGSFKATVNLSLGSNYFYFAFQDKAGNKSKTTIEIKRISITKIVLQIGKPDMFVNGKVVPIDAESKITPIIEGGRTLIPIRAVVESLGGYVSWDKNEKKITLLLDKNKVEMWVGKNTALVNGKETYIDSSNPNIMPKIISGRTFIPLRFVAESLGAQVDWDNKTQTIVITYTRR